MEFLIAAALLASFGTVTDFFGDLVRCTAYQTGLAARESFKRFEILKTTLFERLNLELVLELGILSKIVN